MINKHLVRELSDAGIWSDDIINRIIANRGSIQSIETIPSSIRSVFKTAWEIPQKAVVDMAVDRGAFICQSQSLNVYMEEPSISKLTSLHFHAWKMGLKTGMYYLRTRPKADAIQFTVDQKLLTRQESKADNGVVCSEKNRTCILSNVDEPSCQFCSA